MPLPTLHLTPHASDRRTAIGWPKNGGNHSFPFYEIFHSATSGASVEAMMHPKAEVDAPDAQQNRPTRRLDGSQAF